LQRSKKKLLSDLPFIGTSPAWQLLRGEAAEPYPTAW
jgi:hypothetical protein